MISLHWRETPFIVWSGNRVSMSLCSLWAYKSRVYLQVNERASVCVCEREREVQTNREDELRILQRPSMVLKFMSRRTTFFAWITSFLYKKDIMHSTQLCQDIYFKHTVWWYPWWNVIEVRNRIIMLQYKFHLETVSKTSKTESQDIYIYIYIYDKRKYIKYEKEYKDWIKDWCWT